MKSAVGSLCDEIICLRTPPAKGSTTKTKPKRMTAYSRRTELLVACYNTAFVVLTLVWKTVGLEWLLPNGLGQAWNEIFDPQRRYYPRRFDDQDEAAYDFVYLILYGILGLLGQSASIMLVVSPRKKKKNCQLWWRLFATFHVVISIYHVVYAHGMVQGKLILPENSQYFLQVLTAMETMISLDFAVRPTYNRTRKIRLDFLSFCTVTPWGLHLLFNWFNLNNDILADQINFPFFIALPFLLCARELKSIVMGQKEDDDEDKQHEEGGDGNDSDKKKGN